MTTLNDALSKVSLKSQHNYNENIVKSSHIAKGHSSALTCYIHPITISSFISDTDIVSLTQWPCPSISSEKSSSLIRLFPVSFHKNSHRKPIMNSTQFFFTKCQQVYDFWRDHFQNELGILYTLNGKGISPRLYMAWLCGEEGFMVMQRAPGISLRTLLQTRKKEFDLKILKKVMFVVGKLHECGVAHGDLHCDNVFIDFASNRVTLIDFGNAMKTTSSSLFYEDIFTILEDMIDIYFA